MQRSPRELGGVLNQFARMVILTSLYMNLSCNLSAMFAPRMVWSCTNATGDVGTGRLGEFLLEGCNKPHTLVSQRRSGVAMCA